MAHNKLQARDDDNISHYGSMSGETFASRRSRRDCSLRMTKADLLAKNLREYHARQENGDILDGAKLGQLDAASLAEGRWNKSFHNYRILVVMMGGISVGLMLLMRYSITIAILKMVNQTHLYLEEHPNKTVDDFLDEGYSLGGEFNWNNEIVAIILSWYMFSYTLPQMPTSRLSAKIGCRLSVPISLALCAVSMLLTPWAAYLGWKYVVVLRLVNGVGASAVLPMLLNLVEIWMRYDEISLGLSVGQTLNSVLMTLTPLIAGYLAEIHWSYAFYIPGAFTLLFCLLWLVLVADSPETSKFVSAKELMYIRDPGGDLTSPTADEHKVTDNKVVTTQEDELAYKPDSWVQILRVPSFYAYILMWCFFCSSYCGFNFIMPTYMRQFLKIPVSQNGFYCFIIQTGTIVAVLWPHPLLRLLQRFGLSITKSRIIAHFVCCSMVAATWIYVGFFHDTQLLMLFINRCFHSGNDVIVTSSLMSNYAKAGMSSIAFSLVNTLGNLSIVFFSTLIGWVLDYTGQSREAWCWIYTGLGASQILMFLIFAIFIDSDPIKFKNKRQSVASPTPRSLEDNHHAANNKGREQTKAERQLNNFDSMKKATSNEPADSKDN